MPRSHSASRYPAITAMQRRPTAAIPTAPTTIRITAHPRPITAITAHRFPSTTTLRATTMVAIADIAAATKASAENSVAETEADSAVAYARDLTGDMEASEAASAAADSAAT